MPAGLEFTSSGGAGIVQVGDFNGDGFVDVIQNNAAGSAIIYLQNNGSGSFITPAHNPFGLFSSSSPAGFQLNTSSSIADFDGDGDLDIWHRVNNPGNDNYLKNEGGTYQTATVPPGLEFTSSGGAGIVQVGDFNGDGFVDVLQNNATGSAILYLQNTGSGSFITPASHPFSAFASSTPAGFQLNSSSSIADFDGDGDVDIWHRVNNAGNDNYLRNDGGTYGIAPVPSGLEFTSASGAGIVQVGDFNGDGAIDVAQNNATGSAIIYLQNNGSGVFSTPVTHAFSAYAASTPSGFQLNTSSSIADFDDDGDLDIWHRVNNGGNDNYLRGSGVEPTMTSSAPAANATNFGSGDNLVLTFSENVVTGAGNIYIRAVADDAVVQTIAAIGPAVSGSGTNVLTINPPANLAGNTAYYLTFDRGAIRDANEGIIFGYLDSSRNVRVPYTNPDFLSFTTTSTLPVHLLSFTVTGAGGKALIEWQTASEEASRDFTIQYSTDGQQWKSIGTVAAAGTATDIRTYRFTDPQVLAARNYYRLLQADLDGTEKVISQVRLLEGGKTAGISIYPNPAGAAATLQLPAEGAAQVVLYSAAGQEVWRRKVQNGTKVQLPLAGLPSGSYQVVVLQGGVKYTQQLYKK
ncbi:MAG TPA: FG-GAP-like repeat-containing protein [Chitinophagaceae bacterium]|nr:FG-GAP-like repeat-containing protein [Chitinophagaceae bacterium]